MNRIVLMVLRNIVKVVPAYAKLCHYAKHLATAGGVSLIGGVQLYTPGRKKPKNPSFLTFIQPAQNKGRLCVSVRELY